MKFWRLFTSNNPTAPAAEPESESNRRIPMPRTWGNVLCVYTQEHVLRIHLRFEMPSHLAYELERDLEKLLGVSMAAVSRYQIMIERGQAFRWEELLRSIGNRICEFAADHNDEIPASTGDR